MEECSINSIDLKKLTEKKDMFLCPTCRSDFSSATEAGVTCARGHSFPVRDGLPLLFSPHLEYGSNQDVTHIIKDFYTENPFPDYEELDCVGSLIDRSVRSVFTRALDQALPFGARILDVGCGTGQMSIFLSLANRQVFGVDLCPSSLQLGRKFRDRHGLKQVYFYQMNLFRPIFKNETFDLVFCSGVLHHTTFPFQGFQSICKLVKPNKYIIVGLYNTYLRIPTHIRRWLSKFTKIEKIDPIIRRLSTMKKRQTWFKDQYRNPYESCHTIREVAGWFKGNGFMYVNSIPATHIGQNRNAVRNPFQQLRPGSSLEMFLNQVLSIPAFSGEGGLFLVVGKRCG